MRAVIGLVMVILAAPAVHAWNAVGHETVAAIAWENMTPNARRNVVALLQKAPADACLLELFPQSGPVADRPREFFILASKWADIVRPGDDGDTRECTRYHRRNWHFINYFWGGTSGSQDDPPTDLDHPEIAEVNAVERLGVFRPMVACDTDACGTADADRATTLAWILHLVGDIHQPLHTSGRVTTRRNEHEGDQGGNLFKIGPERSLHSYWDGIVNLSIPRRNEERDDDVAYVTRVARTIMQNHPRASLASVLDPGDFEAWSLSGLQIAKDTAYPQRLRRGRMPDETYRQSAFAAAERSIALGGYRLADLLNQMFDD